MFTKLKNLDQMIKKIPFPLLLISAGALLFLLLSILKKNPQLEDNTNATKSVVQLKVPAEDSFINEDNFSYKQTEDFASKNEINETVLGIVENVAKEQTNETIENSISQSGVSNKEKEMLKKLFSLNDEHYTLQVMAVSKLDSIRKFHTESDLPNSWYALTNNKNNQNWYVMYYGDYASKEEATTAIQTLSVKLKELNPWPRKIADIKEHVVLNSSK